MYCSSGDLTYLRVDFGIFPSFGTMEVISPPLFALRGRVFNPVVSMVHVSPVLISVLYPSDVPSSAASGHGPSLVKSSCPELVWVIFTLSLLMSAAFDVRPCALG